MIIEFLYMKISVIVPVYNVDKYIEKCLDSLVHQTFDPSYFQIILVNDCSTDKSLSIIKKYLSKYKNIILINNNKNEGPGNTRNKGLKFAKGKYVFFLDSDDYISKTALSIVYNKAKKYNADVVAYNFTKVTESSKKFLPCRKDFDNLTKNKNNLIKKFLSAEIDGSVIFSFIKREILSKNDILFQNIIHEDTPVIFQVYYFSEKIIKLNDIIYYKVFRDTSIVNNLTKKRISGLLTSFRIVLAFLKEKKSNINEFMPYYLKGFAGIVGSLIELNLKFYPSDFSKRKYIYNYIFENIEKDLRGSKLPDKTYKDKICNFFYNTYRSSTNLGNNAKIFEKKISNLN